MLRRAGDQAALWPLDSTSGGTWIGVNERGVAAFLLNANPPEPAHPTPTHSRGELVPLVLAAMDVATAEAAVRAAVQDGVYPWFRLVLVGDEMACVLRHLPGGLERRPLVLGASWLLTSSSLGDELVRSPREALYAEMQHTASTAAERLQAQRAYHAHSWPGRGELSVNMRRSDAATRSYCEIDLHADRVCLRYQPTPPPYEPSGGVWTLPRVRD